MNPYPGSAPRVARLPWIRSTPRTLPLTTKSTVQLGAVRPRAADPDVDAIYRLAPRNALPLPFFFDRKASENLIALSSKTMFFNAQATLWFRDALRRSIYRRRCTAACRRLAVVCGAGGGQGLSLAFSPPVVEQDRNAHDWRLHERRPPTRGGRRRAPPGVAVPLWFFAGGLRAARVVRARLYRSPDAGRLQAFLRTD